MYIHCTICRDLFVGADSEEVFATKCGHLFHSICLNQWFERSESCPHCRQKLKGQKAIKLFFSTPNPDSLTQEDPSALQNKIQCMNFQMKLKDTDIKNLKEDFGKITEQNKGLKQEIKKMREEIRESRSSMYELEEQLRVLKQKNKRLTEYELEIESLKKKIDDFKSLEEILHGSSRDTDETLLRSTLDPTALRMCVSTFKKELAASKQQKLVLQDLLTNSQKEGNRMKSEVSKLNDDISVLRRVNQKLKDLKASHEQDINILQQKNKELQKSLSEAVNTSERYDTSNQDSALSLSSSMEMSQPTSPVVAIQKKREELSIFRKSTRVLNLQSVPSRFLQLSQREEEQTGKVYNGLGGLSRSDDFNFSNREKFKNLTKKKNLSASAGSAAKKLKADPNNLKLHSFFK